MSTEQLIYPPPYQVIPKHLDFKITKEGELLNKYISFDGFNLDNIQTFDHFINTKLPEKLLQYQMIMSKESNQNVRTYYRFTNLLYHNPKLTPLECKNGGYTYSLKISANIEVIKIYIENNELKQSPPYTSNERNFIISIPVPLGSQYSNVYNKTPDEMLAMGLDQCEPKGYFIVDGIEYFTTLREELQVNKFIIYNEKVSDYHVPICIINCLTYTQKNKITMKWNQKASKAKSDDKTKENHSHHLSVYFYMNIYKRNDNLLTYPVDKKTDTEYNIFTIIAILYYINAYKSGDQNTIYNFNYENMIENFINDVLNYAKSNEKSAIKSKLIQTKNALNLKNLHRPEGIEHWKYVFNPILVNKGDINYQELYEGLLSIYNYFFPQTDEFAKKYNSFTYMTYIYCRVLIGKAKITDRDSWNVKQLTSIGTIYERQFNMTWKSLISKLNKEIKLETLGYDFGKISSQIAKYFDAGDIEKSFTRCFLMNNWNTFKQKQQGLVLSSMFERKSQLWSFSQLSKIEGNVETKSKNMSIRTFKPSQAGFVCFIETPDGNKCGIIKHKAMTAQLTIMYLNEYIDEILNNLFGSIANIPNTKDEYNNTILCVNGIIYGWINGRILADHMRQIRRSSYSEFNKSLAIVLEEDNNILYLNTGGDCLVRPLLIVDQSDHKLVIDKLDMWNNNFEDLIRSGCVEYIDPFEQEHIYISETVRGVRENKNNTYTHSEMDPTAIFGISAAMIPYANMNQGPRNLFQCKFGTQAITVPMTNYQLRTDVNLKVLAYPSQPLVQTQAHKLYNLQELPIGQTSILAIGVFEGFNQEDALIVKRSFVERGAFRYTKYVEFKFNKRKIQNTVGANPLNYKNLIRKSQQRYKNIDQNGIPIMNSIIRENDCVIGRVKKSIDKNKQENWEDVSVYAGLSQDGVVDRIIISDNIIIVRLRQVRMPIEGDKFAPRHAQKTTIGRIVNDEDMPFSPDTKLVPDMILNPHAIPSRMTIGLLIEMLTSKIGALKGEIYNATAFNDFKVEELYKELKNYGYESRGYENMIDGRTGNRIRLPVYVGPCYYLMLYHNIRDKIQQRAARGKVSAQTRQPIKGRANRGGPREGEMERDSYISHGALGAVYSSLCLSSDYYQMIICKNCGSFPKYKDKEGGIYECPVCERSEMLVKCSISYVFKTFMQLLNGIGIRIVPKFLCQEDEPKYREIKKDIIEEDAERSEEEEEEDAESAEEEIFEEEEEYLEDVVNELEEEEGEELEGVELEGIEIENEYD